MTDALEFVNPNILELADPTAAPVSLKPLLTAWRLAFFPLLDRTNPQQARIHQWIIPTLALESQLESTPQDWWEIGKVVGLISDTIAAVRHNGFVPAGAQETAMVAAFNASWT
jgi:hypothetical protein